MLPALKASGSVKLGIFLLLTSSHKFNGIRSLDVSLIINFSFNNAFKICSCRESDKREKENFKLFLLRRIFIFYYNFKIVLVS